MWCAFGIVIQTAISFLPGWISRERSGFYTVTNAQCFITHSSFFNKLCIKILFKDIKVLKDKITSKLVDLQRMLNSVQKK